MSGRGRSRGDAAIRAALGQRLGCGPTDPDGLLPTIGVLRAWFEELSTDGDTEGEDAEAAAEVADYSDGDGAAEFAELEAARLLPGRRISAEGLRTLLNRISAHVEASLEASPPLLEFFRIRMTDVIGDALSEVPEEGVSLRNVHNNAFGCVFDELWKLLREE